MLNSPHQREDWHRTVQGDPGFDLQTVATPYTVDWFKVPVLESHGEKERRVSPKKSRLYAGALKAAGKTFEYVVLPGTDHGATTPEAAQIWFDRLDGFLAKYNPAGRPGWPGGEHWPVSAPKKRAPDHVDRRPLLRMVGVARIELATPAMSTQCSTTELYAHAFRCTCRGGAGLPQVGIAPCVGQGAAFNEPFGRLQAAWWAESGENCGGSGFSLNRCWGVRGGVGAGA